MGIAPIIRRHVKAARRRGARWVEAVDVLRLLPSAEGLARLWTRYAHRGQVHQTSADTSEERYPELFDLAARLMPNATRILSFGCSTGEEIVSLRRRFRSAEIIGAEVNARSRRIARRRLADDPRSAVVSSDLIEGSFDAIFALAALQREPHRVIEMDVQDLTSIYSFSRFDAALGDLVSRLRPGGLLCVDNAQYRVEDSSAADQLASVAEAPRMQGRQFGRDGRLLSERGACTMFRKNLRNAS